MAVHDQKPRKTEVRIFADITTSVSVTIDEVLEQLDDDDIAAALERRDKKRPHTAPTRLKPGDPSPAEKVHRVSNNKPGPLWLPTWQVERMMRECQMSLADTFTIDIKVFEGLLHDSLLWRKERAEEAWRKHAAIWLEHMAAVQEVQNNQYPAHAAEYKSWGERPELLRLWVAALLNEARKQRNETWLLFFEDPDHGHEVYSGADSNAAAFQRFQQARTNWSCHLFVRVAADERPVKVSKFCSRCQQKVSAGCGYFACPFPMEEKKTT